MNTGNRHGARHVDMGKNVPEPSRWAPGDQIVLYEMWGEGIGSARPVTVVEDSSRHIALYSQAETHFISRGFENRHSLNLSERMDLYMEALDPTVGEFTDRVLPDSHVLTMTPPNAWHSVWLFWSAEWEFRNWYVNFEAPLRRVSRGVQVHDYALDIVVQPDMSWQWKDEAEFEALIARGFFSDEQVVSIRSEAELLVSAIDSAASPFCDGWENWRPDPLWPKPWLPADWSEIC